MRAAFPGYYRPSTEDLKNLWDKAFIAFDANVLLGVYRYTAKTRENLFAVLHKLKKRVWLPHQAGLEFQRNRIGEILAQEKTFEQLVQNVQSLREDVIRHPFLGRNDVVEADRLVTSLGGTLDRIRKAQLDLTDADPLRDHLDTIFADKVGSPPKPKDLEKLLADGKKRFDARVPPGYKDKDKPEPERYGDVVLWFELMSEAKERRQPLLFVTDDDKEDWWEKRGDRTFGPRSLLLEEFGRETGQALYMYRSAPFLKHAQGVLNLRDEEAVEEVRDRQAAREELDKALRQADALLVDLRGSGEPAPRDAWGALLRAYATPPHLSDALTAGSAAHQTSGREFSTIFQKLLERSIRIGASSPEPTSEGGRREPQGPKRREGEDPGKE